MAKAAIDLMPLEGGGLYPRARNALDVRRLSQVDNWRGARAVAFQWGTIGVAAAAAIAADHWAIYLVAIVVIATRQHALLVLGHEATHYRLFTHRGLNDVVGDLLLAYPLGVSLSRYRPFHLDHHRYSFTDPEKDPETHYYGADHDMHWPKSRLEAARVIAKDCLGLSLPTFVRFMKQFSPWAVFARRREPKITTRERAALALYGAGVAAALSLAGLWIEFLLLWILPMATVLVAIFRFRSIAEHSAVEHDTELNSTRTVLPTWLDRALLAPCNVNYHLEHHLYPSVPFYNLPELHRVLCRDADFRDTAHVTAGYTGARHGVLAELTTR